MFILTLLGRRTWGELKEVIRGIYPSEESLFLIKFMQYFFKTSILFVMIEVIIGIGIYGGMMIMLKDDLTYECYESLLKRLTKKIK